MPKTKNAFALRNFDAERFIRDKLLVCGLKPNALISMDTDKNNFVDMQQARKSYLRFDDELKKFRRRLIRHNKRYQRFARMITDSLISNDTDEYYLSVVQPRRNRLMDLSDRYTNIATKILAAEKNVEEMIYQLEQYQQIYRMQIFAGRLRVARKAAGLTQEGLAKNLGIKRNTYAAYETARNVPNVSLLASLSTELQRPTDWLLGLTP